MNADLQQLFTDFADPSEDLPPELLLDPEHPDNDPYFQQLNHINRAVMDASARLRPLQKHAVMLHRTGLSYTEIAKKLDIAPATASRYVNSTEGKRFTNVLEFHQRHIDGPQFDHRKNILYRIALEQQKMSPGVAINAIKEINKMTGTYGDPSGGFENNGTINIQINGELLPRGVLDTLPNTYETRQAALNVDGGSA
jgi:hypothetical protein